MFRLTRWRFAAVAAPLFLAACASSSAPRAGAPPVEAGPGTGGPCATSDDCDPSECACSDGTSRQVAATCTAGACPAPQAACATVCSANGGVKSAAPAPNVVGSAECTAFCSRALSLKCAGGTSCRPYYNCMVGMGECSASVRAELACEVEAGSWACDSFGDWAVDSTCGGAYGALCVGDAGAD